MQISDGLLVACVLLLLQGDCVIGGENFKRQGSYGCFDPFLTTAVKVEHLSSVNQYLDAGFDMYAKDCDDLLPMQIAISMENNGTSRDFILAFIDHEYDVNHVLVDGSSLLMFAITNGSDWAVDKLLEMGSLVNFVSPQGSSPLLEAVITNRKEVMKKLLNAGAVAHLKLPGKYTYLQKVVERGNYTAVQTVLTMTAFLDDINEKDETALAIAIKKNSPVIMNLLLARGAFINQTTKAGENYVYIAAKTGSLRALPTLFEHGLTADTELKNRTALEFAIINNNTEATKVLLKYNPNVHRISKNNQETYLHIASRYNSTGPLAELLKQNINVELLNALNETAMTIAVKQNRADVVELLLPKMSVRRVIQGRTYVHVAAEYGSAEALKPLLKGQAPVDDMDSNNNTALMIAILRNHSSVADILLTGGADTNMTSLAGESYLYTAVKVNSLGCIGVLLNHGISPDVKNNDGETPIRLAVKTNATTSAELLKSRGADLNQRWGNATQTLMHLAAFTNCPVSIVWLYEQGLGLDLVDNNLFTPLHYAAWGNAPAAATELLRIGCCVNCRNRWNETALTLAEKNQFTEVAAIIKSKGGTN